ncbi:ABC transporter ATP-binding protein [Rhodococcus wratislaviensis]|nr:ABC transporter ATP-binding protein [Rhodococcus wratislaviensis]
MEDVAVAYGTGRGALQVVRGVTIDIAQGETVGLVGESGCGKSTLAKAATGMLPLSDGRVLLEGADVTQALRRRSKHIAKRIQMVFQDPHGSLNPRMTVGETLAEAISAHRRLGGAGLRAEVTRLLDLVGLGSRAQERRPGDFSGGQKQRIAIARALAVQPSVLIADEITSALDVSVQASILNLLRSIQSETGVACLFISHNLSVVRYISDRVAVMHLGRIVEQGPARELFDRPEHPYTRVLLDSVPQFARTGSEPGLRTLREPVDPHSVPSGCEFRTRCPMGPEVDRSRHECMASTPRLIARAPGHQVACHFAPPASPDDRDRGLDPC